MDRKWPVAGFRNLKRLGDYHEIIITLTCPVLDVYSMSGSAYEEIQVLNGGTISGKVIIEGGKPRAMAFNLVTIPDPVYCGRISTGTGWRLVVR